jgi:hypothetical protein
VESSTAFLCQARNLRLRPKSAGGDGRGRREGVLARGRLRRGGGREGVLLQCFEYFLQDFQHFTHFFIQIFRNFGKITIKAMILRNSLAFCEIPIQFGKMCVEK